MGLTVREHLVLAHRARVAPHRLWRDMLDPALPASASKAENERVDELLELLRLTRVAKAPVAALPLGILRLVEVGRALASEPNVLLLDEPLSGLDIKASENLLAVFRQIVDQPDRQVSLIMVEHDVAAVLSLSDIVFVLDFGERIAVGQPGGDPQRPRGAGRLPGGRRPGTGSARRAGARQGRPGVTEPLLKVEDLDVRYGSSQALFGVSVTVEPGTVLAVLGANGAGKSTLARAVSGSGAPDQRAGRLRRTGHHRTAGAPHPQARPDLHPRRAGHLPGPLRGRQPAHGGRPRRSGTNVPRPSTGPSTGSRCWASAGRSGPAACRGASSRCWPWPGPWPSRPS